MLSIQTIAVILLIARLISVGFILFVLRLQWKLFKSKIDFSLVPNLDHYQQTTVYRIRRVLFVLAVIIFLGNMIPILIDAITIFSHNSLGRTQSIRPISVAYAVSNAFTAMFSAIMIWTLYKLAGISPRKNK